VRHGDRKTCGGCGTEFCSDCVADCARCRNIYCSGCLTDCAICGASCCSSCLRPSAHSNRSSCSRCRQGCDRCGRQVPHAELDPQPILCPVCRQPEPTVGPESNVPILTPIPSPVSLENNQ